MAQTQKVSGVATKIFTDNGMTNVVYHKTAVVKFNHSKIVLNSGGWRTVTTKTRMNQTSNQFNLGYQVFQKDFEWYVDFKGQTLEFTDGMELIKN